MISPPGAAQTANAEMPNGPVRPGIKSFLREALEAQLLAWGWPKFRVGQVLEWVYAKRVRDWEAMTTLSRPMRQQLREHFELHSGELVCTQGHRDATVKFLWRLRDQALIESVLIPANPALYGEASDRRTLCVSTQVGCAYGCKFCASGLLGWKRNLTADEIVEQVLAVEHWYATPAAAPTSSLVADVPPAPASRPSPAFRAVDNLVIMGLGEPLANYDHLLQALRICNAPWGCGIGARKITISTSGLAPQIRKLADEPFQFRLAISLHGATDEVRSRLMPVNRKYPLAELTESCLYYLRQKGKMITLEYILIAGVNDSLDQVTPLANLAQKLHAKVNLIPYNRVDGLDWMRPSPDHCELFRRQLESAGTAVTLRQEKGHDIDAACGQLRLRVAKDLPPFS